MRTGEASPTVAAEVDQAGQGLGGDELGAGTGMAQELGHSHLERPSPAHEASSWSKNSSSA